MKKWILILIAMILTISMFCACTDKTKADTIVYGSIYTADEAGNFAEAVAIKDGKYIYVGDKEGAQQYIGTQTETIEGAFVMPSGVESHAHYILEEAFKQGLYIEDYNEDGTAKSIEEMLSEIVEYRENHPDCEGVFGYGWNSLIHTDVSRNQIDAVIDDIPVYIAGRDLHSGWCNTKCLEMAGVLNEECSAKGVERDKNGIATGHIRDEACSYVRNKVFGELEGYDEAITNMQEILLSKGYTMLLDPWSNFDGTTAMFEAVDRAENEGALNMVVFESYCIDTMADANPFETELSDINKINVIRTYFEGKSVFKL